MPPTPRHRLSIIIPSRRGPGEHTLDRLLADQLPSQSLQDFDVHVVVGDDRQGRAINEGVRRADGEIIFTMDDDIELGGDRVLENLVALLDGDPTVGIAGASCPVPPDASPFQRAALRQIPRRYFPVVRTPTDSDMVQHGCLAMRRDLFRRIGGEDEDLIRGLDPIIRARVREEGLRCVIAPDTWFYHRPPGTPSALMRMYFRNGRGSAFAARRFPDRVLELGDGFEGGEFPLRRPFGFRVGRRLWRTTLALFAGEWVRFSTDIAYIAGFAFECLDRPGPPPRATRRIRLEGTMGERVQIWRSVLAADPPGADR